MDVDCNDQNEVRSTLDGTKSYIGSQDTTVKDSQATKHMEEKNLQGQKGSRNQFTNFQFPEGGWECQNCFNYNFKGRTKCRRCYKERDALDLEGKPYHL